MSLERRTRLNYYTCALLSSVGEILISLDDPKIHETCKASGRDPVCNAELTKKLAMYTKNRAAFPRFARQQVK